MGLDAAGRSAVGLSLPRAPCPLAATTYRPWSGNQTLACFVKCGGSESPRFSLSDPRKGYSYGPSHFTLLLGG